jgi:hypothetical protein
MDVSIEFNSGAEYERLSEKWTKNTPKVDPNGSGYFSQRKAAGRIDDFSADYLMTKARFRCKAVNGGRMLSSPLNRCKP